jgi:two-component system, NarL family, response regulator NreC
MSTRVLIANEPAELRATLKVTLEADGFLVDEAETLAQALLAAGTEKPDVILLGHGALELVPTLLHESAGAKIVVLGGQDDPQAVQEAFAAGASGYVLADTEVVPAVREVAGGGRYVNPELGARLVAAESQAVRRDGLSEREHEVLRLLALGYTNQEIAKQLVISVRTAETHRAHIMQKLGLSSRAELVRYALDRGLLQNEAQ